MDYNQISDDVEPILYPQYIEPFRKLVNRFEELQSSQQLGERVFLLSVRWLRRWKTYVSYDELRKGEQASKFLSGPKPWNINEDIVEIKKQALFKYYPIQSHRWNVWVRNGLKENVDFVVIGEEMWNFFRQQFNGVAIEGVGEKSIEVQLKVVKVCLVNHTIFGNIRGERLSQLFSGVVQVSGQSRLEEWIEGIERTMKTFKQFDFEEGCVRLWRMRDGNVDEVLGVIKKQLSMQQQGGGYYVSLRDVVCLEGGSINECDIGENDLVLIDTKERGKQFVVRGGCYGRCEWCKKETSLSVECGCKEVGYCKEACQQSDEKFHVKKCKQAQMRQEEQLKWMVRESNSVDGKCGLMNIGNTCYMNSALQCISNTVGLCEYLLHNVFEQDINLVNPLGSKGELAMQLSLVLKHLWLRSEKQYCPDRFKKTLCQLNGMFCGQQQHDAMELLMFVLDGLHEDLNLVKQKPYVELPESNGRDDFVVALEHWDGHQLRNQSVIVDLFHGQLKSKLHCPQCDHISITFDPFMVLSLPLQSSSTTTNTTITSSTAILLNNDDGQSQSLITNQQVISSYLHNPNIIYDIVNQHSTQSLQFTNNTNNTNNTTIPDDHKLVIRPMTDYELNTQTHHIPILIHHHSHTSVITLPRTMHFNPQSTLLLIIQILHSTYQSNHFIPLLNSNTVCPLCTNTHSNGCPIPSTSTTLQTILNNIPNPDYQLQIILLWNNIPSQLINHQVLVDDTQYQEEQKDQHTSPSLTLNQCLQYFSQSQKLDQQNTWYCKKCKQLVQATMNLQLFSAPQYLIINLKRFKNQSTYYKTKLETFVHFPIDLLDLTPFLFQNQIPSNYLNNNDSKPQYSLYALINHYGGLDGGHYIAIAKNKYDDKWYSYDDSIVKLIHNPSEIVTEHAYVLFYQRN